MVSTIETEIYDEELTVCPDCGYFVTVTDTIESTGMGVAIGHIRCDSCDFRAREEWVIDRTVKVEEVEE